MRRRRRLLRVEMRPKVLLGNEACRLTKDCSACAGVEFIVDRNNEAETVQDGDDLRARAAAESFSRPAVSVMSSNHHVSAVAEEGVHGQNRPPKLGVQGSFGMAVQVPVGLALGSVGLVAPGVEQNVAHRRVDDHRQGVEVQGLENLGQGFIVTGEAREQLAEPAVARGIARG